MANILEIKNLNYGYGKTTIFKDFNLSVEEGSYIGIAGNNNSGKTTLIKLISGILPSKDAVTIGYSYVDNNRIHDNSKRLGIVFGSSFNLFLFDDVYKEMAFPLENLNISVDEIEKRIIDLAKDFGISKLLDKKTIDLTNSERQEVQLVISLLHSPDILLLDNPFSMMNRETKNKILKALKKYHEENKLTIILATTNLEDVLDTDYIYVLNDGDIIIEGKTFEVLEEDTILNKLGFSLPFMVDLSLKLKFYELLDDIEVDMNRMVDVLWK